MSDMKNTNGNQWWQKIIHEIEKHENVKEIVQLIRISVILIAGISMVYLVTTSISSYATESKKEETKKAEIAADLEKKRLELAQNEEERRFDREQDEDIPEVVTKPLPECPLIAQNQEELVKANAIVVNNKKYNAEQRKLLTIAYYTGQEVGYPETIQALLLQETNAGEYGNRIGDVNQPMGKRSYGVMQVKVATAHTVMKRYPTFVKQYFPQYKREDQIRSEELIIKLIQDDEFNIRVGAYNFMMMRKGVKTWEGAIVAYNTGIGAYRSIKHPKLHKYYKSVVYKISNQVRPFNEKGGLVQEKA